MSKALSGSLLAAFLIVLATLISGCATNPPSDEVAQTRQECRELPAQTGSRTGRRVCRDVEEEEDSDA